MMIEAINGRDVITLLFETALTGEDREKCERELEAIFKAKIGCTPETLRIWIRQQEPVDDEQNALTASERQRLKELEREVRELRRSNDILRQASAYFAQPELDRRSRP